MTDADKAMLTEEEVYEFPASFAQQRMWLLDQMSPGNPLYNTPAAVKMQGRLDAALLEHSLQTVVQRHEVLQTTFELLDGEPMQVVKPARTVTLQRIDLQSLPQEEREVELTRLAKQEALHSFDLEKGPLLRAVLVQTNAEEHVLLLNLHHIISDGWSVGVLIREITALYAGKELPELPLQYADFTLWQQEWLEGDVLDEQLAYWEKQLGGQDNNLTLLALPTDDPRPVEAAYDGATHRFAIPKSLLPKLTALAKEEGATLYMVLLAAFQTLLHRYTGQQDVSVGTPVAGRGREEIEGLIGLFVNTLVMRADVDSSQTFRELLRQVRTVTLDAYAHGDVPFEKVVERLQPERSRAYSPLFQVMFMLHNATTGELALPGVQIKPLNVETGLAKFDLSLMVEEEAGTLCCAFEYRTDLFAAETIARMAGHFLTLVEGIVERPEGAIGTLPLLTEGEQKLLIGWNETAVAYPQDICVHELFEQQAAKTPDAVAVVCGTVQWTYRELDQRANQTAHLLRKKGVRADTTVGISIPRSPEQVAALLGVLKAGGAYLPLDPALPAERLRFMEQDAGVVVTLTAELMQETLQESLEKVDSGAAADHLAYLLYTSGSTGTPKGVAVPHRALCNHMFWMLETYGLTAEDRVLQKTSFGFDASGIEFYAALLSGARLVLASPEEGQDSAYLVKMIAEQNITVLGLVPSLLQVMLEEPLMASCTSLRHVFSGGEALSGELQERFFARLPHTALHNLYGPTEACIDSTAWTCQPGEVFAFGQVPIGRPIHNVQTYVLNVAMQPVPAGVVGELHIGGTGLARGYWNRPELTEEKFVTNPLGQGLLYKTGDLVRYRPDGALEFVGRIDQQVKVRGFRIETGEVEAVILAHQGVREALVSAEDNRLTAYLAGEVDLSALKRELQSKLPEYMVPTAFLVLDTFPRTANGKIDRAQLPAPAPVEEGRFVAPQTPLQEDIAAIWRDVLGVEEISVEANFFELGGYSLLASQVMARLRQKLEVDLPLRTLFDAPTVAGLAAIVEGAKRAEELPALQAVSREQPLPLSFAQERVWFFEQLQPGTAAYHIPSAVRLEGTLDVERLTQSLNEIVRRHEALRTTFTEVDGQPKQVVHAQMPITVRLIDEHELEAEAQRPFDLEKGPLLRAALVRHSDTKHLLLVTLHHIVTDGWSMGVFIRELTAFYGQFAETLSELPIQYADYANWQREWLQGDQLQAGLAYWKKQLGGTQPVLQLPTDRPRPAVQTYRGAVEQTVLSPELHSALLRLSEGEEATLFMTLLAAYQTLLYRYTGQEDLRVGTPVANRSRVEVEELIGFFVNTLVVRADVSKDLSFRDLLRRVRETALDAFAHGEVPFEQLVKELQPERDLSHTPLFQTLFVLQNAPRDAYELPGLTVTPLDVSSGAAKFDLTLSVVENGEGLLCQFEYNADLFDASTIQRMAGHFETLLKGIAADMGQAIGTLPIMTDAEREELPTSRVLPSPILQQPQECLQQMFEAQALRTPDAVAVTFDNANLTYRELNERANHLAHHLRAKGVGPDVLVGLCTERTPEMIIGLLGILKAGGAYVPLDPTYPAERLSFLLTDANVRFLVTQESLTSALPAHTAEVIHITDATDALNPSCITAPDNVAYVIYTSGSTGQPKGVLIPHANVARLFTATAPWFQFDGTDVWTLFHSYAFDFSVWEIWGALLHGGRLVIVPYLTSRSPEQFYDLLCAEGVTVLNQTPSAFRQLIQADAEQGGAGTLNLRYVIFGGEALEMQSLTPWFDRHGEERPQLINMYGITETTVHVTYRPLTKEDLSRGSIIGVPIPDLHVRILDANGQPVPLGIPGELYVGGAGVAKGYLNRPELTAERFADGFYKTGDLARLLANGDLEYLGRIDQQVKIRGFRIELGEIESALVTAPAVREAVVTAQNDRLYAYIVPEPGGEAGDLRSFLQQKLPDYMLPSAYLTIERLPLTPNGKVDLRALPQPGSSHAGTKPYTAPQTAEEKALCAIFEQVLGVENVGLQDNFFELGGDSILSIQVVAQARKLGYDLPLQEMFRQPSVQELATALKLTSAADHVIEPFALLSEEDRLLLPESIEDAYPLTKLQAGMLFHSAASGDASAYHNVNTYHLRAPFDEAELKKLVAELAQHHPVLRTAFDLTTYSEPLQLVHREVEIPLVIEDLRHLSRAEQEREVGEWFEREKASHFDWSQAPLLRLHIHRRTDDTYQFSFTEHHAILDGWSVATLITEFFHSYLTATPMEQPVPLFRDYVALETAAVSSDDQKNFWLQQLDEFTFTKIPRLPRAEKEAEPQQMQLEVPLPEALSQSLKDLALHAGVPVKSVLLAAHLRVLSYISGHQDVCTGVVANGRPEQEGGERALGLFLNTLPFRQQLQGGTWLDLIRATFTAEQDVLPYRRYPMMQIQQDHGGHSLFETAFNFTHFHVYSAFDGLSDVEVLDATGIADTNFALSAEFSQNTENGGIGLLLRFDGSEFDREQITALAGFYTRCFQAMTTDAEARYETHSLLSTAELHQLADWKRSAPPHPSDLCAHELIALQAAQTPDKSAVVFESEQLTYRQLDEQANRLARHLQACGVGPDTLVGISVERSLEMIVGVLGILKAGGAFVPLDPNYPQERIAYMIEDAGLSLLLTQARFAENLQQGSLRIIRLDADWPVIEQEKADPVPNTAGADNLSYVIYTSGSTGQPKGVLLQHKGLSNMAQSLHKTFHVDDTSRVLQFASFSFDASVSEFMVLVHGGTLYLAKQDDLMPGPDLLNTLRQHKINTVTLPPSALAVMPDDHLPDLQTIISAGEACTAELIVRWSQGRAFINGYGPSEATCCTSAQEYRNATGSEAVLIGRPFAGVDVYVLDEQGQPVPVGTPGELHVGGICVGRGYLNRPELTAEKFIDHDGERLYKTGDLVRWLPDGRLEYISRRDHQVKIRGFRIETGEIENLLSQHPSVQHVIVLVREDVPGDKRLAAYLVLHEREAATADHLRDFLQDRLPEYMVPSHLLLLDAMPLTPNGKIDRRALPAPMGVRPEGETEYAAPRDTLELELVQLWESLLHIAPIGIRDNFFLLGGHSLLAVRMMAMIQKKWGQDLPFSALSQGGTIEYLAAMLRGGDTHQRSSLIPLQAGGTQIPFFCVHAVGGSVLSYVHLAKLLGVDQPFYGLQSPGLDDDTEPFTDITAMAAHYIAELRTVQPQGPYHLGGWSLGGVMAYEMAQQLQAAGEEVALLAIFDSFAPLMHNRRDFPTEASMLAGFSEYLAASSGVDIADGMEEHLYTLSDEEAFEYVLEQSIQQNILPRDIGFQQFYRLYRVFRANLLSVHDYTPQPYAGGITLFKATEFVSIELATKINDEPTMGWGELVQGEIDVHHLPGTHFSIVRPPHVEHLAQKLEEVIHCSVTKRSGDRIGKTEKHQS